MKYVLAIFGVFVVVVLAIVLFRGNGSKNTTDSHKKPVILSDVASNADAEVTYTLDGPITAEETHYSVQIKVTPQERVINVIRGYQNEVVKSQRYDNNADAFAQFLQALNKESFTKDRGKVKVEQTSVCPTGVRYTFEISDGADELMRTWAANCTKGTFGGNIKITRQLFQAQIPDYMAITAGANFSSLGR